MTPDELLAGYEWAKAQFYSPEHIFKRLNISRTGLWWNIPRNLGYLRASHDLPGGRLAGCDS